MVKLERFDVCLVNLAPTIGSEIKKTRPALIISPNSMNLSRLKTIIVAPMTTTVRNNFPTRVDVKFKNKFGQIALDQLSGIDRTRIIKNIGCVDSKTGDEVLRILGIMFQP